MKVVYGSDFDSADPLMFDCSDESTRSLAGASCVAGAGRSRPVDVSSSGIKIRLSAYLQASSFSAAGSARLPASASPLLLSSSKSLNPRHRNHRCPKNSNLWAAELAGLGAALAAAVSAGGGAAGSSWRRLVLTWCPSHARAEPEGGRAHRREPPCLHRCTLWAAFACAIWTPRLLQPGCSPHGGLIAALLALGIRHSSTISFTGIVVGSAHPASLPSSQMVMSVCAGVGCSRSIPTPQSGMDTTFSGMDTTFDCFWHAV